MKHLKVTAAISLTLLTLTACQSVPQTKFTFNVKTGSFLLESPKQITLTNLTAGIEDGTFKIKIGSYTSHNDADILNSIADANARMAGKMIEMSEALMEMGKDKGAKAVVPVP